jgi:hypothetical protein
VAGAWNDGGARGHLVQAELARLLLRELQDPQLRDVT